MPSFKLPEGAKQQLDIDTGKINVISKQAFDTFNPSVLGLGDIKKDADSRPAVAAFFDLQGFTVFCKQIEPHLSVPIYLSGFLSWIFSAIRKETIRKEYEEGFHVWHDLPFLTKFMGDGLLVLWDTRSMTKTGQHNLILSCDNILDEYEEKFYPAMRRKVSDVPPILRCGLAKGMVFSVGDGEDYVGSCINVAARLQKLAALPIAFARRGFDPEEQWKKNAQLLKQWVLKSVSIRGIGQNELVYVKRDHFDVLPDGDKKLFVDP